jgi:hypothetical protein
MQRSLRPGVLSLAALAAAFAPSASGSVVGNLVVGVCAGGSVVLSTAVVDWVSPNPNPQCLRVVDTTAVISLGNGTLTSPPPFTGTATINDIPGSPGASGYMSFSGGGLTGTMAFDLGGFGVGIPTACTAGMAVGDSCSVAGTPYILTYLGSAGTLLELPAAGTIVDTLGDGRTSWWSGSFTGTIQLDTPFDIRTALETPGGSVTPDAFHGTFDITDVPEPVSMALIGGGLIVLAAIKRRKRV